MTKKTSIFIGSSSEALRIAGQVQHDLQAVGRPKLWNQGVFGLGWGTLESLINEVSKHDFAVLVMSPDDRTTSREIEQSSPRDNVVFELGLFMGRLGRERAFVLYDKSANLKLLSDLAGITTASYDGAWAKDDLEAAIGAACHPIKEVIRKLGPIGERNSEGTHFDSEAPVDSIGRADIHPIVWTEEELKQLKMGLENATVALEVLDLASDSPGVPVTFENACYNVGVDPIRGRRHIASMTQVVKRLGHAAWPVTQSAASPGSKLGYIMTADVATRWQNIRSSTAPKRYTEDFTRSGIRWENWEVLTTIEGVRSSPEGLRLVGVADRFATIRTREGLFPTSGDWTCKIAFRFEEPRPCGTSVKITGESGDILDIHQDNTHGHYIDFMGTRLDAKITPTHMIEANIVHRSGRSIIYINGTVACEYRGRIRPRHIVLGNVVACNQGWSDLLIYRVEVIGC